MKTTQRKKRTMKKQRKKNDVEDTNVCSQLRDRNVKGPVYIPERQMKSGVVIYGFTPAVPAPTSLSGPDVAAPPSDRYRRSGELRKPRLPPTSPSRLTLKVS